MIIRNHQTGDKAVVVFSPYSKVGSKYRHIAGEDQWYLCVRLIVLYMLACDQVRCSTHQVKPGSTYTVLGMKKYTEM